MIEKFNLYDEIVPPFLFDDEFFPDPLWVVDPEPSDEFSDGGGKWKDRFSDPANCKENPDGYRPPRREKEGNSSKVPEII